MRRSDTGLRRQALRRPKLRNFPRFGGMYLSGAPGAIPPHRFRHLENVRFQGDDIVCRGGLSPVNTFDLHSSTACIKSIDDFQVGPRKIYCVFDGCPGIDSSLGFSLNWFDHELQTRFSRGIFYNTATNNVTVGIFSGRIYVGVDSDLKVLQLIIPPYGQESLAFAGVEQASKIETFTGFTIRCLAEFDGKLFIGLDNGAGASKISVYDGVSVQNDITGIDPPSVFKAFRDTLVVGFTTSGIRHRAIGAAPGTWTAVAGALVSRQMESYRDILYITGGSTDVWSFDGTTLAVTKTIAGAQFFGLVAFDGFLFAGYQSGANVATLARRDSSGAWVDAHKNFTAQVADARLPRALVSYRGSLVAGVNGAPGGAKLYQSPGTATSGT